MQICFPGYYRRRGSCMVREVITFFSTFPKHCIRETIPANKRTIFMLCLFCEDISLVINAKRRAEKQSGAANFLCLTTTLPLPPACFAFLGAEITTIFTLIHSSYQNEISKDRTQV